MRSHAWLLLSCTCLVLACGGDGGGPSGSTATISGTVTSAATGAAVAGATVTVGSAQATSEADGSFELTGVQPGASVQIACARAGFLAYSQAIAVQEGSNSHDIALAAQEIYTFTDFALLVPATAAQVRGVVVALPGPDTRAFVDGRPSGAGVEEAAVQEFSAALRVLARDSGLAILGTNQLLMNEAGSDAVVLAALQTAAAQSGHPELSSAPWILFSAGVGASEVFGLTLRHPDRVAAFVLRNPRGLLLTPSPAARQVPGFFNLPGVDDAEPNAPTIQQFLDNRAAGAVWLLAVEPGQSPTDLTSEMSTALLDMMADAVGLRLPAAPGGALRSVQESSGWLGNLTTFDIASYASYGGDPTQASWLPTAAAAARWRDLVTP